MQVLFLMAAVQLGQFSRDNGNEETVFFALLSKVVAMYETNKEGTW
jgi:hypothetical protein